MSYYRLVESRRRRAAARVEWQDVALGCVAYAILIGVTIWISA